MRASAKCSCLETLGRLNPKILQGETGKSNANHSLHTRNRGTPLSLFGVLCSGASKKTFFRSFHVPPQIENKSKLIFWNPEKRSFQEGMWKPARCFFVCSLLPRPIHSQAMNHSKTAGHGAQLQPSRAPSEGDPEAEPHKKAEPNTMPRVALRDGWAKRSKAGWVLCMRV